MGVLIFILVVFLGTFTAFLIKRHKLIKKVKQEMDEMTKYASDYRQKLLDEGVLEDYKCKSAEELQNELHNLVYRLDNLRYPEEKEAILEAHQRKAIIEEVLDGRKD